MIDTIELPGRPRDLLHPPRRGERGPLQLAQPRHPDRRRPERVTREPRPAGGGGGRGRRAGRDGLAGARHGPPASGTDPTRSPRTREPGDKQLPRVDGHLTAVPGLGLLVLVADCYPVALSDGERVGDAPLRLAPARRRHRREGGRRASTRPPPPPSGPGSAAAATRSGRRCSERFAGVAGAADGRMLDLRRVIEAQLQAAGVSAVAHLDRCTSCEPDLYFSHRRDDGVTGRQGGLCVLQRVRENLERVRERIGSEVEILAAVKYVDAGRPARRSPRRASSWSARTAPRTCSPSRSATATCSPGTSSARSRAASSRTSPRTCA